MRGAMVQGGQAAADRRIAGPGQPAGPPGRQLHHVALSAAVNSTSANFARITSLPSAGQARRPVQSPFNLVFEAKA
jgi:hypothetical protein